MPTVGELINKQPTISAQKRTNNVIGVLADILKPLSDRADKYALSNSIPLVGGMTVAELTGLKGAQGLLDDVSYGAPVVRGGSFQTAQIDPRVLDVAGLVPTVGGVLKGGGMYGKALAKEVGRNINEGTTIGQMLDPRMNMIAYHGSPHSFDKFSMDKIGTGEGAQAYGHGLYFADSPEVAKQYANELGSQVDVNGNILYKANQRIGTTGNPELDDYLIANVGDVKATKKNLLNDIKEVRPFNKQAAKEMQKTLSYLRKASVQKTNTGTLYKVDISDDAIPNMLLWDKPLTSQPKIVQDAIKNRLKELGYSPNKNGLRAYHMEHGGFADSTGETLVKTFFGKTPQESAEYLKKQGIQGIRYLDAGSRGKGAGTMNTVVFDDSLVKILEKNGKPVGAK